METTNAAAEVSFADVDVLISELETQFEKSTMLPKGVLDGDTNGCTKVTGCTGTCPCGD
jgi:hypothetical protein